jgi:hypothetical protein
MMNRSIPSCRILASLALSLGLIGCGSDGIETGMPKDPSKSDVPLNNAMLDRTGKMGPGAAKKAADDAKKARKEQAASPGGGAPAENK